MRYLILCLLALTSVAHTFAQSVTALQSTTDFQSIEGDGTLLTASLGLPYNLLSLPLIGNQLQPIALVKPAATKPVVAVKPVAPKPAAPKPAAPKPAAPKPVVTKPVVAAKPVAPKPVAVAPQRSGPSYLLKSTAYNSHASQTDRTPFITATGARTRFGVIALSRDMLRSVPYGSLVRIEDLGAWGSGRGRGTYNRMLSGVLFQVEDTMHPRKVRTVDVWFYSRSQALKWGARQVKLTIIRRGR